MCFLTTVQTQLNSNKIQLHNGLVTHITIVSFPHNHIYELLILILVWGMVVKVFFVYILWQLFIFFLFNTIIII